MREGQHDCSELQDFDGKLFFPPVTVFLGLLGIAELLYKPERLEFVVIIFQ